MRAGLCSVVIKVFDKPGILRVYAKAEGLIPARLDIDVHPAEKRPSLYTVDFFLKYFLSDHFLDDPAVFVNQQRMCLQVLKCFGGTWTVKTAFLLS